ncbi:MAG: type IV pilus modification PilV family protein [Gemmatimonadales bacterium]
MRDRRGAVLLEALVALAILSVAGVALLALVTAAVSAERDARGRERSLGNAERVLAAATLLRREELDQRIGMRPIGEFVVHIQRPERTLYRIAIADVASPQVDILVTVVYRPEPAHP